MTPESSGKLIQHLAGIEMLLAELVSLVARHVSEVEPPSPAPPSSNPLELGGEDYPNHTLESGGGHNAHAE